MFKHYFTSEPTDRPKKREIDVFVRGYSLKLITYSGVFSYKKLDNGTKLLVESMIVPDTGRFLDLGCGYGVIGIVAGLENPSLEIWFIDTNKLAINATKQNAKRYLDRSRFRVIRNDGLDGITEKFNAIVTNPPFSAGKDTVFKFIHQSYEHLVPGGWLELVARKSKGGKSTKEEMERVFGNVEVIGRGSGYQVYHSIKE